MMTGAHSAVAAEDDGKSGADAAPKEAAPTDAKDTKDEAKSDAADADTATSASGETSTEAGASTDAEPEPEVAGATPAAAAPALLPAPPGDVARLPAEAYPNDPIRGIEGGSLWMTFHGLQWPVSPFHTETPETQLGLSGSAWVDTGYKTVDTGAPNEADVKRWLQQGRFVLRATPTYVKGDWFVQGQAEFVANKDQTVNHPAVADTDDLWLRAGRWNQWDVQIGRYEAWELYHLGMGLDLNTVEREGANDGNTKAPPNIYGATFAYYRPSGVGNVAFHVYPKKFLRAELLGQIGSEGSLNTIAARPAVILDFGVIKLKGGAEYLQQTAQREGNEQDQLSKGGGGAVQVVLDPRVEFGVNGAYAIVDVTDAAGGINRDASITTYSVGGFANARIVGPLLLGLGANYTRVDDIHYEGSLHGEFSHFQAFGALQAVVLDQLFIKAVFAYAKADYAPTVEPPSMTDPYTTTALSGRLRLMYLF